MSRVQKTPTQLVLSQRHGGLQSTLSRLQRNENKQESYHQQMRLSPRQTFITVKFLECLRTVSLPLVASPPASLQLQYLYLPRATHDDQICAVWLCGCAMCGAAGT